MLKLNIPIIVNKSFIAIARRTKFIHIGIMNSIKSVPPLFKLLFARIYATGYARIMQIIVVASASKILIIKVERVVALEKNLIKLPKDILPFWSVKA